MCISPFAAQLQSLLTSYLWFKSFASTYQQLHTVLSGHLDGRSKDDLSEILSPRLTNLSNISNPFGVPSDSSKKKIESGEVELRDGVKLKVEDADKQYVFAVSKSFNIDEVEALILMRSFLYNEGLPSSNSNSNSPSGGGDPSSVDTQVEELLEAITPFYYSERLFVVRSLIPLFRSSAVDALEAVGEIANDFLPQVITPNGKAFAESILTEYSRKCKHPLPRSFDANPRKASQWVKQNTKEQLVLLEVLFWTMWEYANCDGPLVVRIYETAYSSNLGSNQQNGNLLLDEEGAQLLQDNAALWILLTIEILELERVAEPGGMQISGGDEDGGEEGDKEIYWSSPESLMRIHQLVLSHEGSQFACIYLAWSFVLSRILKICSELKALSPPYLKFVETLIPRLDRSYANKEREPVWLLMSRSCLDPEVGLFQLMLTLLTSSPLYVTAVAWRTGSTVTDPNAVAYRSVLKGLLTNSFCSNSWNSFTKTSFKD